MPTRVHPNPPHPTPRHTRGPASATIALGASRVGQLEARFRRVLVLVSTARAVARGGCRAQAAAGQGTGCGAGRQATACVRVSMCACVTACVRVSMCAPVSSPTLSPTDPAPRGLLTRRGIGRVGHVVWRGRRGAVGRARTGERLGRRAGVPRRPQTPVCRLPML